jgi:hypothetical protein
MPKMETVMQSRDRIYTYARNGRVRSWIVADDGGLVELIADVTLSPAHQSQEALTEPNGITSARHSIPPTGRTVTVKPTGMDKR